VSGMGQARTESLERATKKKLALWRQEVSEEELLEVERSRPRTRGECGSVPRPCPYVGCKHNLYLEAHPRTGNLTYLNPSLAPEEVPPEKSCVLDVADTNPDGMSYDDIADVIGVSRERVRQLLEIAGSAMRKAAGSELLEELCDSPGEQKGKNETVKSLRFEEQPEGAEFVEAEDGRLRPGYLDRESPLTLSLTAEAKHFDEDATRTVWRIFMRESIEAGYAPDVYNGQQRQRGKLAEDLQAIQPGGLTEEQMYVGRRRKVKEVVMATEMTERQEKGAGVGRGTPGPLAAGDRRGAWYEPNHGVERDTRSPSHG